MGAVVLLLLVGALLLADLVAVLDMHVFVLGSFSQQQSVVYVVRLEMLI